MIPRLHGFYPCLLPELNQKTWLLEEDVDEESILIQAELEYEKWESAIRNVKVTNVIGVPDEDESKGQDTEDEQEEDNEEGEEEEEVHQEADDFGNLTDDALEISGDLQMEE